MSSTRRLVPLLVPALIAGLALASEPPASVDEVRLAPPGLVGKVERRELVSVTAPGPWDEVAVSRTRESLLSTGRFSSVEPAVSLEGGKTILTFALRPRPWVRTITVEGNRQLSRRRLLERLDLKVWRALPDGVHTSVPLQVAEAYERSGFPAPEVSVEVGPADARGASRVTLRLTEVRLPHLASFRADLGDLPWFTSLSTRGKLLYLKWDARISRLNRKTLDASLREEQRRLRSLGWKGATFRVEESPAGDGEAVAVAIHLDLGPREKLKGKGVDRPVMREATASWKRRNVPLSEGVVNRLARVASEGMVERGYADVAVTPSETTEGSVRTVVLSAVRGPRHFVERIRFDGATSLSESVLKGAIPLFAPRLLGLSRSHPGPALLEESRLALLDLYKRSGFPDARVEVETEGTGPGRTVVFTVSEGQRRTLARVSFPGARRLGEEELRRLTLLKEGDPYWPEGATAAAQAIREEYARLGFDEATVTPRAGAPDAEGRLPLSLEIAEGTLHVVGRRVVRGNFKTRSRRILSVGNERTGEPVDPVMLAEHQTTLSRLGVFDTAAVASEPIPGSDPPAKTVFVDVVDRPTGFLEYGLDLNTQRGLEVAGTVGERNLFGLAMSGSLSALLGKERQSLTLEYGQPALFGTRLVNALRATYIYDKTYPGFALQTVGVECGFSWEFDPKRRLTLVYKLEDQLPVDIEPDVAAETVPEQSRIGSLTPTVSLDGRDDPFLTTRGSFFLVRDKASRRFLGGESDFDRWELDGRHYRTLGGAFTLAGALRFGYARGQGDTDLPLGERFFVGGASTHRGFPEKELGPVGEDGTALGGESYALANVELRVPLVGLLDGGLFLDVGNAYLGGLDLTDLRWAAGAGLRLRTPVGPLRLDLGIKLDRREGESPTVWHVALGHAF